MASRMVVEGTSEETFSPEEKVTRADFIVSLVNALGLGEMPYQDEYEDVNMESVYASYIETAYQYGLMDYDQSNQFNPEDPIVRSDAFEMIAHAMSIMSLNSNLSSSEVEGVLSEFSDTCDMDDAYKKDIASVINFGIVSGTCNHELALERALTKAEMATLLNQLLVKSQLIE